MGAGIKHIIVVGNSILVVALFVVVRHCFLQASTHDGNIGKLNIPYSLKDNNLINIIHHSTSKLPVSIIVSGNVLHNHTR